MNRRIYKLPFPPIPPMPDEIVDAIDSGNLLLFVGAGISKLMGYPLWSELGENLANKAVKDGLLSLSEKEVLLNGRFTPMQVVTLLSKTFDNVRPGLGLDRVIEELSTNVKENGNAAEIATYLSAYNATIVTTNADESLETKEPLSDRKILKSFKDFDFDKFAQHSIIHLHGDISEPSGMVFTSEQYAEFYSVSSCFGQNLNDLFRKEWTILFIGYGVSEFELIRYFLKLKDDKVKRMFMLDGYLAKDRIKYEFDEVYFRSLGIFLLPYSREKNDYGQLLRVLKRWDKDVKTRTLAASAVRVNAIKNMTSQRPFDESVEAISRMINRNG